MLINLFLSNKVPSRIDALSLGGVRGTNARVGLVGDPSLTII
jgi:hypothetical protein